MEDNDYCPSPGGTKNGKKKRGRRSKRGTSDEESEEGEEEDFLSEEDDEPLHWSSPNETEDELDSNGEEYVPKGRNAKRAAMISKFGL